MEGKGNVSRVREILNKTDIPKQKLSKYVVPEKKKEKEGGEW